MNDQQNDSNTALYKISGITLATFFGSVIAGGFLCYLNFKRLGQKQRGVRILIFSAVTTILILGAAVLTPENVPNYLFTLPQIIIMHLLAKKWFADAIAHREQNQNSMESNWKAFGISILFLILLMGAITASIITLAL